MKPFGISLWYIQIFWLPFVDYTDACHSWTSNCWSDSGTCNSYESGQTVWLPLSTGNFKKFQTLSCLIGNITDTRGSPSKLVLCVVLWAWWVYLKIYPAVYARNVDSESSLKVFDTDTPLLRTRRCSKYSTPGPVNRWFGWIRNSFNLTLPWHETTLGTDCAMLLCPDWGMCECRP